MQRIRITGCSNGNKAVLGALSDEGDCKSCGLALGLAEYGAHCGQTVVLHESSKRPTTKWGMGIK